MILPISSFLLQLTYASLIIFASSLYGFLCLFPNIFFALFDIAMYYDQTEQKRKTIVASTGFTEFVYKNRPCLSGYG